MSGVSESIPPLGPAGANDLTAECDRMEAELGAWLARRAAQFRGRRDVALKASGRTRDLRPSVWRVLIQIWATSPGARARFSSEARTGLLAATKSMDGTAVMFFVEGLLAGYFSAGAGPASA